MVSNKAVLPVLFLAGAAIASAQLGGGGGGVGAGAVHSRSGSFSATMGFPGPMPAPSVTGAPFSGVREYERTQTLADGTHISQKNMLLKLWRDADGRTRTERPMAPGRQAPEVPKIVEIVDPVAGYRYTLDQQKKIAHRVAIAQRPPARPAQNGPASAGANSIARPGAVVTMGAVPAAQQHSFQHEDLGTKTIDGWLVRGNRTTMTIPTGEQGNDRPLSTITESWASPDLRETIESTTSDPRMGETTIRLTNIDRNNPDPTLFQVPADYEVVDEQGPFSINYSR